MRFLLIIPVLGLAKISILAESMQGTLKDNNLQLSNITINANNWLIKAQHASYKQAMCILLTGAVQIKDPKQTTSYFGPSFKYCPQSATITALAPIQIINQQMRVTAKKFSLNLKTKQASLTGIKANA